MKDVRGRGVQTVYKLEMDMDELRGLLGEDEEGAGEGVDVQENEGEGASTTSTPYDPARMAMTMQSIQSGMDGDRSVALHDVPWPISEQPPSLSLSQSQSPENHIYVRNLGFFRFGQGLPRWSMHGLRFADIGGGWIGSLSVTAITWSFLGLVGVLGEGIWIACRTIGLGWDRPRLGGLLKGKGSKGLKGKASGLPWLSLLVLGVHVSRCVFAWYTEEIRFRGVGYRDTSSNSLWRRLIGKYDE